MNARSKTWYTSSPESADYSHVGDVFKCTATTRQKLDPRHDLRNHSPDGFGWGYHGSGAAQLALALLADATGDWDFATRVYQDFKNDVVAKLPRGSWELTESQVRDWAEAKFYAD